MPNHFIREVTPSVLSRMGKTGRSPHRWVLKGGTDRVRVFFCSRCGAGPVRKDVMSSKGSIAAQARLQGLSNDCNHEVVRKTMED